MSKVNIEMKLKSNNDIYEYKGLGIKQNNKIIFIDNNVKTIITLEPVIYLERKKDYYLKLGFSINKKIYTTYNSEVGLMDICTITSSIKHKDNTLNIKYKEYINDVFIDEFKLFLKYSIDTPK